MTDFVSLRAGDRRIDFSTSSRDAAKVSDWDWGNPTQTPTLAPGIDGGIPVGTSALESERQVSLDVKSTYGNVTGDADGYAVNRVVHDEPRSITGSGTLTTAAWPIDLTDLSGTTIEVGCEVICNVSTSVAIEVLRGTTVVATVTRTAAANEPLTVREVGVSIAGTGVATIRAKITGAPASTTLTARRPIVGVGLDGVYHGPHSPGVTIRENLDQGGHSLAASGGSQWTLNISSGLTDTGSGWALVPDGSDAFGYRCKGTNTTASLRTVGCYRSTPHTTWFPVAPGTQVAVGVDAFVLDAPTTNGARIAIDWVDGSGATVGSTSSSSFLTVVPGAQRLTWLSAAAPSGAVRGRLSTSVYTSTAETVDVYFTRWSIGDYLHTGYVSRPARGERWANAFLQAIDRAVAAVRNGGAELVRSSDGLSEVHTFDLNSAEYTSPQKGDHKLGHAEAKISSKARPLVRLETRPLAGEIVLVDGLLPVFVASEPVPGSDDALGDITVTWDGSRRDARVAVCGEVPEVWEPTAVLPSWSELDPLDGAFGGSALWGWVPQNTQAAVVSYVSSLQGRVRLEQRIASQVDAVANLVINGRTVASAQVVADPFVETGMWRIVDFGVQTLAVGDHVAVHLSSTASGRAYVNTLLVSRDEVTAALITQADDLLPADSASGDDFPVGLADDDLDGRTALLGGTWNATGWWRESDGYAHRLTGSSSDAAELSSSCDLGAVGHATVDVRVGSVGTGSVGLFEATDSRKVVVKASGDHLALEVTKSTGGASYDVVTSVSARAGDVIDARIQIDDAGRVIFFAAPAGQRLRVVGVVHFAELAGGVYKAAALSPSTGGIQVFSLRLLTADALPYTDELRWAAGATGRLVSGRLPRLRAGSRPTVFARSAATPIDSPSGDNVHPTGYVVSVTPRVLSVSD